jgi:uncharacterized membrane protein YeaQ/YmgE (transglycosylase-associated protein family)
LSEQEKGMFLLLYWIVSGAVVGWLTGIAMSSEGRDYIMDIVMGLVGAIGGGFLFTATQVLVQGKMIYIMLAAMAGAAILAGLTRYVGGNLEYGSTD